MDVNHPPAARDPFTASPADDTITSFLLPTRGVRGRLVRLAQTVTTALGHHAYPFPVAKLLGEALALTSGIASFLEVEDKFILQTSSDGAVSLLVVDITPDGGVRGYAQCTGPVPVNPENLQSLTGKGYLAFTATLGATKERYQGIVTLEGLNLATAVEHYFNQSVQLPTRLIVTAHQEAANSWRAVALLVQRLPEDENQADDMRAAWDEVEVLLATLTNAELLDSGLAAERLLYHLFGSAEIRVFPPKSIFATCRCTSQRLKSILANLPNGEIATMWDETNKIEMNCAFCNKTFEFTEEEFV
ncbi:MAG: Hsp33 family molecular chaperone HslO [Holosporales bacterium]|jgi:molecular chaperone Hsp33